MDLQHRVDKRRTPAIARAIIERERHSSGAASPTTLASVFTSLEETVSALVGRSGYRALVRRAVPPTVASSLLHSGESLSLPASFPSAGWDTLSETVGPELAQACATALLVDVLDLLCDLIGADLTYRLLEQAWQGLPGHESGHDPRSIDAESQTH
jgi:hypothetical protein